MWLGTGVVEVGREASGVLSCVLRGIAHECVASTCVHASKDAGCDDAGNATPEMVRRSNSSGWSLGHLVRAYSDSFPAVGASGRAGWGEGWRDADGVRGDSMQDDYYAVASTYTACLQHALRHVTQVAPSCGRTRVMVEAWQRQVITTAAAAVHRGTELVWAQRVALAASASQSAGRADGDAGNGAWGSVGLGGYDGYGSGSGAVLETERAYGGAAVPLSSAQLKKLALSAARVRVHLELLRFLIEGREASSGGNPVAVGGEREATQQLWEYELEARVVAVLAQARHPCVWGVEKEVAGIADELLQHLSARPRPRHLARWPACAAGHGKQSATAVTADTGSVPCGEGGNTRAGDMAGAHVGAEEAACRELVARVMWQQCREALEHDDSHVVAAQETASTQPADTLRPCGWDATGGGQVTPEEGGCEWEWAEARRGGAFLRACSLVWLSAQLAHAEGWRGNETTVWLGAALSLLQQPTFDLKAVGARLLVVLLRRVRVMGMRARLDSATRCWSLGCRFQSEDRVGATRR